MDIYKLAEYLPEGGHWGDPIWPRDVEHIVQAATAAEREACAKIADSLSAKADDESATCELGDLDSVVNFGMAAFEIAAAIRARGDHES